MGKDIINKRLIIGMIVIIILFSSIALRLTYLQVFKHEEYNTLALRQRSTEIEIDSPRGYIFDKNLKPLTNNTTTPTIIVPKILINKDKLLYSKILQNTNLSYFELKNYIEMEKFILQIPLKNSFDTSNYNNVFIVDIINRYDPDNLLSHVIGYINKADNSGVYGLEKAQDEFLEHGSRSSIFLEYDDKQSFLIGATEVHETTAPMDPTSVVTTIDVDIQKNIESIMDDHEIRGSVIVTEVETGNISAIASRPNMDQEHIYNYLEHEDMTFFNRAIQTGYPPGSIFKIVVLLAALEENHGIVDREFFCHGYETVYGRPINCSSVHGHINLKEAFSKSCNTAFIQIGKEIGAKSIIDMAWRLNFGEKINIGLTEEIKGNLPKEGQILGAAIGNISIGQGEILVTPLQISNLLMIIANNGVQKDIKLVEGISNDEGYIIKPSIREDDRRIIIKDHAALLSEYLVDVVENGTGNGINLDDYGSAGGKTGSAEAILNKRETVHGWFAGFYPAYNPKYAITVFVEEGMSGSESAAPIFQEICVYLSKR